MKYLSKAEFLQDGFAIVDNIIDPLLFEQIKLEIGSVILAILRPTRDFNSYESFYEILGLCNNLSPSNRSLIYSRLQQVPHLLAVPSTKRIMNIASNLLGQDPNYIGVWPRVQVRLDLPMVEETEILWHTDYLYNRGTKYSLTFWIPITSYSEDMGGICYIPKSHKLINEFNFKPNHASKSQHNYDLSPDQLLNKTIISVKGVENQGVLFDSQLVHSGVLNKGSLPRVTILFRMQDLRTLERNE